ncbi:MAG: hypothetical protein VX603_14475 [Gemmatimonadota bacterium]|nr:hypothetical protein [Gemmatimonadota bacterium]
MTEQKPVTSYTMWSVIRKCLMKDRDKRMQTAREMGSDLETVQQDTKDGTVLVDASTIPKLVLEPVEPEPVPVWRQPMAITLMVMMALVIGGSAIWFLKPVPEPPLRKFAMEIDPVNRQVYDGPVVSPDGSMTIYSPGIAGNQTLWIRDLDSVLIQTFISAASHMRCR